MYLLFHGRNGHFFRIAVGIALVAFGLVSATPVAAILGSVLIVWGVLTAVGALGGARSTLGR